MEEFNVFLKKTCDIGQQRLNYSTSTRRCFLNECIRQLHLMKGNTIPVVSMTREYNKSVMWQKLNSLMKSSEMTRHEILLLRVKRRLFQESKTRRRKLQNPQPNSSQISEAVNFKPYRYILGVKKISRNYLDEARKKIRKSYLHQKLKRKLRDRGNANEMVKRPAHFNSKECLRQISQEMIIKICQHPANFNEKIECERYAKARRVSRRAKKVEEMLNEQHYRELCTANIKLSEASVRSILYMKTLLRLMISQEDGGYPSTSS